MSCVLYPLKSAKLLLFLDKLAFDWGSEAIRVALLQKPQDDRILGSLVQRFLETGP